MTESKPPGERLLDLLVFGPAGLAITAAEEFPKLADKGRHRIEGQLHTARLVGQFALQMGRRQIDELVGRLGPRPGDREGATSEGPPVAAPPEAAPRVRGDGSSGRIAAPATGSALGNGSGDASGLAIPGYDSLSASQVVQRLDGLSRPELEDVRSHELTHRHRRTILHRIDQLLAGADGDRP